MCDWMTRFWLRLFARRPLVDKAVENCAVNGSRLSQRDYRPQANDRSRKRGDLPRKEADYLTGRLELCMAAMQQACSRVEADFLNIGGQLQSIYAQAARMTQNVQAAIEHIGLDADSSTLGTILRTAHRALDDLGLEQARMAESMKNVRGICEDLYNLRNMARGLGRIAKALRMVAININIESSRAGESWDNFSVLSQEIRALSNTVTSLDQTLFSEIQAILKKLETMQLAMAAKLRRFAKLADDARTVAGQAEPECRILMDRSVKALQQVGADGETISRNTSQIVVSLQIHDNVSQRVAHIAEALDDSRRVVRQLDNKAHLDGGLNEPLAAVDANLDLQRAQLANIIADIGRVFQSSEGAFKVIGDTVQNMTATIFQMARGDTATRSNSKSSAGSIGSLQAALEKIQVLLGQGDEAVNELKGIGQDATDAVSRIGDLMEQVRKVNFDIHLKSLNAILQSTQLGVQGRAISVLVQEMKDLATQSKELVEQTESINSAIMNQAGRLQEHLQAGLAGGQGSAAIKSEELDASMRDFSEAGAVFTQKADEMTELSQTLSTMIDSAGKQLAFLEPFAGQLQTLQQQLEACRSRLAPWVPAISGGAAALDKARLADRYTMKQERDIHSTILDGKAAQEDGREEAETWTDADAGQTGIAQEGCCAEAQENEFGENIELF